MIALSRCIKTVIYNTFCNGFLERKWFNVICFKIKSINPSLFSFYPHILFIFCSLHISACNTLLTPFSFLMFIHLVVRFWTVLSSSALPAHYILSPGVFILCNIVPMKQPGKARWWDQSRDACFLLFLLFFYASAFHLLCIEDVFIEIKNIL